MFETRKSATKKLLKELDSLYKNDPHSRIMEKRRVLYTVEIIARETNDSGLMKFYDEQSKILNQEEKESIGRIN